jgi:glycosyltransferase involved in cell wall biosynthesis
MKVLFVSSGKSGDVGTVVKNQGESLKREGIDIEYFIIKPGLSGYLKAIPEIRVTFKKGNFDLVHAHYSLSAFTASVAGFFPLVVSLMGSDAYVSGFLRLITRFFYKLRWKTTIVKTPGMKEILKMKHAMVIPNGVDIERFKPYSQESARKYLGYPMDKKLIVFISVPNRKEKNLNLASQAVKELNDDNVELMHVHDVSNSEVPYYLNAADALLLTSKWEGSVNVVKEAMACNCPIVSTDVGDVRWIIGGTTGCYISSSDEGEIAACLRKALSFGRRTDGRERIIELGIDSRSVAVKLIDIYERAIS